MVKKLEFGIGPINKILRKESVPMKKPSKTLEKKPTINSWKRHALCDSVLSYERNPWKFELFVFNAYYINTWIKLYISFLRARKRKILSMCKFSKKLTVWNAPNICVVDHSKTLVFRDVITIKFFKLRYCARSRFARASWKLVEK